MCERVGERLDTLTRERDEARAEVERLRGLIRAWCHEYRHAHEAWKKLPYNAALLAEGEKR